MNFNEFKDEFQKQLKLIDVALEDFQIEQFYKYMKLLIDWNEKVNLTNITEPKEIITKHFIDSLTVLKFIKQEDNVIDVGTGAGFPGIPIKIAFSQTKIVLLDSLNKRINFLTEVIKQLGLEKIEVVHSRAEDAGQNKKTREKFDVAVSRAVAPLNVLLEYLAPLAKVEGLAICMKASKASEELFESKRAIDILNVKLVKEDKFVLPKTEMERNILVFKKEQRTNKTYPRKAGLPSKKPL